MNRLLLVEDDPSLGYILKEYLEMHTFEVKWAKDGLEGQQIAYQESFDLCILDVMLPQKDGFTLARDIRHAEPDLPLIFLTSRALKVDKLKGFQLGADDYIVKPVDEEELIARIRAILKRVDQHKPTPGMLREQVFSIGDYRFNFATQRLSIHDEVCELTTREAELLRLLCLNQGHIVARKTALKEIWGETNYFSRRSMDVFISKLRKHLAKDHRIRIQNVHGKGFILEIK